MRCGQNHNAFSSPVAQPPSSWPTHAAAHRPCRQGLSTIAHTASHRAMLARTLPARLLHTAPAGRVSAPLLITPRCARPHTPCPPASHCPCRQGLSTIAHHTALCSPAHSLPACCTLPLQAESLGSIAEHQDLLRSLEELCCSVQEEGMPERAQAQVGIRPLR